MGMSSHVTFLRSQDNPHYKRMLKIKYACEEAGVNYPEEVDEYFGGYGIDNQDEYPLEVSARGVEKEYRAEMEEGFEIKVSDIPEDVDVIRFVNSY